MKPQATMAIAFGAVLVATLAGPAAAQPAAGEPAAAEPVRTSMPNDFCIELLGRSLIYNFSYQRMLSPAFGLEASAAGLGSGATSDEVSASLLFGSVGGRFYFVKKDASPFVTAGAVLISASTDTGPFGSDNATANYGYSGLGFEVRSRGGMLFRGTAYGLFAGGGYFIWPGLTLGYAF